MIYAVDDYYKIKDKPQPRVEVCSDNETAVRLVTFYKNAGAVIISVADCVDKTDESLPIPNTVLTKLDEKISKATSQVIIVGIESYLSLLCESTKKSFFIALCARLENSNTNAVYMINVKYFLEECFKNPKYTNSLQIIFIGTANQTLQSPNISITSLKWCNTLNNPTTFKELLSHMGNYAPTGDFTLVLNECGIEQAGLSENVTQIFDVKLAATRFYGITDILPDKTLEILISQSKEKNITPTQLLQDNFGKQNFDTRLTLKRLLDLQSDDLWTAYICMIKKRMLSDTYLSKVLSENITPDNLLFCYIASTAVRELTNENVNKYSQERAECIREIVGIANPLIVNFIGKTQSFPNDDVIKWLNCGTVVESEEIIRRLSNSDLGSGIPILVNKIYPEIADYLSLEFDYGDKDLNAYFKEYRNLKIKNDTTQIFVQKSFDLIVPDTFALRDVILQELSEKCDTALLVVDGMGAEYLPYLLAMAKRRHMHISSYAVASVNLPTSTEFNPIRWDNSRLLDEVKEIDDIAHYGAVKHEQCSNERNVVASLSAFDEVFIRIAKGLNRFDQVIVTADHGSSRLAVLAHKKQLNQTLPWNSKQNGEPLDWRYTVALPSENRPLEVEGYYNINDGKNYWVVRGHNRFPKSGPKLYELHGGASLEERLVPFVVFTKTKTETELHPISKKKTEQLVEKMDFDI